MCAAINRLVAVYSGISQLVLTFTVNSHSKLLVTYTDMPVEVSKPVFFMSAQSGIAVKISVFENPSQVKLSN